MNSVDLGIIGYVGWCGGYVLMWLVNVLVYSTSRVDPDYTHHPNPTNRPRMKIHTPHLFVGSCSRNGLCVAVHDHNEGHEQLLENPLRRHYTMLSTTWGRDV
jgi:hypothetical protein